MGFSELFGGINDLLKQTSDFAKEAVESINDIADIFNPPDNNNQTSTGGIPTTPTTPTYNPNLSWSDFAFTPNWMLLFGGLALLIIALVLRK